jgi:hypothetical protein
MAGVYILGKYAPHVAVGGGGNIGGCYVGINYGKEEQKKGGKCERKRIIMKKGWIIEEKG